MENFNRQKDANRVFPKESYRVSMDYLKENIHGLKEQRPRTCKLSTKSCRLPPINPNKTFLITQAENNYPGTSRQSFRSRSQKSPSAIKSDRNPNLVKSSPKGSMGYVLFEQRKLSYVPFDQTNNGDQHIGRIRDRHHSDVLLSCSLGGNLKSGTVHYKNILPPIGETYKVRVKEYYSDIVDTCQHVIAAADDIPPGKEEWMQDFFAKVRRIQSGQDDILEAFLSSSSVGRRNAMCRELDCDYEGIGAVEMLRHNMIREVLSMYF